MPYVIYGLEDPTSTTIHYVGMTDNVQCRFIEHLRLSGYNLAKNAWVANLFARGYTPVMKTLETVEGTRQDARSREIYWLHHYQGQGPLFNYSDHP